MRTVPPDDFDVSSFFEGIYTFQRWSLFPGHETVGPKNVLAQMDILRMPQRLDGLRVLDIAPWNGFFGFECIRRGAASLVSLGPDDPDKTGYNKVRELLQIENCQYARGSVYDVLSLVEGKFDIVMFLGVIYHLRHPLLALDKIYDITEGSLFVDSPVIDNHIYDRTFSEEEKTEIQAGAASFHKLPMLYFTKADETGDDYNWFMPNMRALEDMVTSSGFSVDHVVDDGGGWASLSATKGKRSFTVGVEGWNPTAASHPQESAVEPEPAPTVEPVTDAEPAPDVEPAPLVEAVPLVEAAPVVETAPDVEPTIAPPRGVGRRIQRRIRGLLGAR